MASITLTVRDQDVAKVVALSRARLPLFGVNPVALTDAQASRRYIRELLVQQYRLFRAEQARDIGAVAQQAELDATEVEVAGMS